MPDDPNDTVPILPMREGARFRILRPHAKGGLGEVFIADDTELHREVALKEILEKHSRNEASRSRFILEAEVTGRLEHPNIVPVYGLGTYADGRPFYAMRFIRGDSLKEAVDRFHAPAASANASDRNLAFRDLLKRFVDVCNAVAFAHSRGILHRDLKPANIMLGHYGETLVVDWGLAKPLASREDEPGSSLAGSSGIETQQGITLGTPAFMSPEQAAGRHGELGPASDVYSLGATLYAILTGRPAFEGDLGDILRNVESGHFLAPKQRTQGVPSPLNSIVLKAMARQPGDRFASVSALAEEIEHYLADEPVAAHRESFAARTRRWVRRHPGRVASIAASILVGLVGLATGLYFVNAERNQTELARQGEAQQRTLAQKNEAAAIRARDQARERYQLALDGFNDMVFGIQRKLEPVPGTQDLRKELLENARRGLKKLIPEPDQSGDPDSTLVWSYFRMGEVEQMLGNTAAARSEYQTGHAMALRIAEAYPDDHEAQHHLTVSFNKLGDVTLLLGQPLAALEYYVAGLAVSRKLSNAHPDNVRYLRDLGVSFSKIGEVHFQQGEAMTSLDYFEKSLHVNRRLLEGDPASAVHQRGVSVGYERVGDANLELGQTEAALDYFQKSLSSIQRLADADPKNAEFQRDLGVSFNKLGDAHLRAHQPKAALDFYQRSMSISQSLAAADPKNAEAQRDLAVSFNKLGNASLQLKEPKAALESYEKGLAVSQRLADGDPNNAEGQRDLLLSFLKIGRTHEATGDRVQAIVWYRKAVAVANRSPTKDYFKDDVAWLTKQIAHCQAREMAPTPRPGK